MECLEISYLTFPRQGIFMLLFILVRVNRMSCLSIEEYPILVPEGSVFLPSYFAGMKKKM